MGVAQIGVMSSNNLHHAAVSYTLLCHLSSARTQELRVIPPFQHQRYLITGALRWTKPRAIGSATHTLAHGVRIVFHAEAILYLHDNTQRRCALAML